MRTQRTFDHHDVPDRRHKLEQQATHLGMEACKTGKQRAAYIRTLVRGIFDSDLPGIQVIGETQIVWGKTSLTPIPEFERVLDEWRNFPREELAKILQEEQNRARDLNAEQAA